MNKKELSIGSVVYNVQMKLNVEIVELHEHKAIVAGNITSGRYVTPFKKEFDYDKIEGVEINHDSLQKIGFVWIDDRRTRLVYYFRDMELTYRYDKRSMIARFHFKSQFTKSYTRISCNYIHELQSIMQFLTGSELEFKYNEKINDETV